MNYTYMVRCQDGTLYTGWTNNLEKRIHAHNEGTGAKYTKTRRPVSLVYYEEFASKIDAQKREYRIKLLTRKQKEHLLLTATDIGILGARKGYVMDMNEMKEIKNFLFDLDGTLLPMNQDTFVGFYFQMLAKRMMKFGVAPNDTIKAVWQGVKAMTVHEEDKSNETAFWECFEGMLGVKRVDIEDEILDFYGNEFNKAIASTQPTEVANKVIKELKSKGKKVYLATNPIFPAVATMNRIRWAGLDAEDFEYITVYENSYASKPNPKYFADILEKFDLKPEECLMIGNDVEEDLAIRKLGVKTYLVTDCIENKKNLEIESEYQGSLEELLQLIRENL